MLFEPGLFSTLVAGRRDPNHRLLRLRFTFLNDPNPLFIASKPPFLTLRVATPSGAPLQALLEFRDRYPADVQTDISVDVRGEKRRSGPQNLEE